MNVGFVGLGLMGGPMAANIARAGFSLTVTTRTAGKAEAFAATHAAHGVRAGSLIEVAQRSDIIIVCVTDSPDVVAVAHGGLFEHAKEGAVIVDMSTISPQVTKTLAQEAEKRRLSWLDAPVSGGTKGATEGTLTIMVGGDAKALETARPVLGAMGKRITHFGASGQGQNAKMANQIMTGVNLLAVCEALTFGKKVGLDLNTLHTALTGGAANSWALDVLGKKMIDGDFKPAFMVKLQQKDLRLVMAEAQSNLIPLPAAALAHQMLTTVEAEGRGDDGTQSLYRQYLNMAGMPLKKD